jgi:pyruvate-formate lyase-activating enzyme
MSKSLNSMYAVNYDLKRISSRSYCNTCKKSLGKEKIDSLEKLSDYSEKEIMQLHGFEKIR